MAMRHPDRYAIPVLASRADRHLRGDPAGSVFHLIPNDVESLPFEASGPAEPDDRLYEVRLACTMSTAATTTPADTILAIDLRKYKSVV
jgi:hypothetical protein